jgi:mRNA interferase RelE/StbE
MFEVILSSSAEEFFAAADQPLAKKLARCFGRLESDPRQGNNVKALKGKWSGYLRYRVGDWRVVYRIDDAASCVYVAAIAHRREVYE